jgi:hypothetical protein
MGIVAILTKPRKPTPFRAAVATALTIQAFIYFLTAMVLDCGLTNSIATYAILFYWASFAGVLLLRIRTRNRTFTRADANLVKCSYFAYLVLLPILNALVAEWKGMQ